MEYKMTDCQNNIDCISHYTIEHFTAFCYNLFNSCKCPIHWLKSKVFTPLSERESERDYKENWLIGLMLYIFCKWDSNTIE